jgi:hypothetical protein
MAKLDHPNLPRLHTFGEDQGSYYFSATRFMKRGRWKPRAPLPYSLNRSAL